VTGVQTCALPISPKPQNPKTPFVTSFTNHDKSSLVIILDVGLWRDPLLFPLHLEGHLDRRWLLRLGLLNQKRRGDSLLRRRLIRHLRTDAWKRGRLIVGAKDVREWELNVSGLHCWHLLLLLLNLWLLPLLPVLMMSHMEERHGWYPLLVRLQCLRLLNWDLRQ